MKYMTLRIWYARSRVVPFGQVELSRPSLKNSLLAESKIMDLANFPIICDDTEIANHGFTFTFHYGWHEYT